MQKKTLIGLICGGVGAFVIGALCFAIPLIIVLNNGDGGDDPETVIAQTIDEYKDIVLNVDPDDLFAETNWANQKIVYTSVNNNYSGAQKTTTVRTKNIQGNADRVTFEEVYTLESTNSEAKQWGANYYFVDKAAWQKYVYEADSNENKSYNAKIVMPTYGEFDGATYYYEQHVDLDFMYDVRYINSMTKNINDDESYSVALKLDGKKVAESFLAEDVKEAVLQELATYDANFNYGITFNFDKDGNCTSYRYDYFTLTFIAGANLSVENFSVECSTFTGTIAKPAWYTTNEAQFEIAQTIYSSFAGEYNTVVYASENSSGTSTQAMIDAYEGSYITLNANRTGTIYVKKGTEIFTKQIKEWTLSDEGFFYGILFETTTGEHYMGNFYEYHGMLEGAPDALYFTTTDGDEIAIAL